ncbi:hypothetical protein DDB_G0273027 [Dictyostelium discoideum AX4]|uniref:tRNA (guanine(9)-N(1))-methyltransferase n=1 Tax=Dictyostelium discoideum TaxID=44689 RepID=Q556G7_DICDI|nr:hypothetical protein DDB_G0274073 [Dictyostelium discoideum AX4]XP_645018.1 hypothetical protein DDB_G0273027 [Dictyostelium discoideum AX4]EAL70470.1 hypothetical protein DDB_G0274073 [Dictyostelium discoideum AX4]EAL71151.1 hypothetical protein DDB_G0273027 [Dictyostelium discoideum AX4]|eukprot:XP_644395.1 hypothetical protein DDB_G0274073 [Dictyostelium discoideum AX4]
METPTTSTNTENNNNKNNDNIDINRDTNKDIDENKNTTTTTTTTTDSETTTTVTLENKEEEVLSKNQKKRLLKTAKWEQYKDQKKQYMREKKKENLKKRKETMTSEEKLERSRVKQLKKRGPDVGTLEGHILFDFEMEQHMSEKEKKSLITQMTFLHGFNKISSKPMNLYATGVTDEIKSMLEKSSPFKMLTQYKETYLEKFEKADLVYLTSDSPNVIQELDLSKKYIVGAIVDHNRLKGITYEKAQKQGIAHAQLPIGEYIQMASRKVLAVNHVFQIINEFLVVGNWKDAFEKVIPKRKFQELGRKKRLKLKKQLQQKENGKLKDNEEEEEDDDDDDDYDDDDDDDEEGDDQINEKDQKNCKENSDEKITKKDNETN